MTSTGVQALDRSIHTTNEWLKEVCEEMGWEDRERGYIALRAVLLNLRDRLSAGQAAHFAAQLPAFVRGIYYEGYTPAHKPETVRSRSEFLERIRDSFQPQRGEEDPAEMARAVFSVLRRHVAEGEADKVLEEMPNEIAETFMSGAAR